MTPKEKFQFEMEIGRKFCAWLQGESGLSCQLIRHGEPPAPDLVISWNGSEIFVELAEYREQGPYNKLEARDEKFKAQLCADLTAAGLECTIFLGFHGRHEATIRHPPAHIWQRFNGEVIGLINHVADGLLSRSLYRTHFVRSSPAHEKIRFRPPYYLIPDKQFATLAEYCVDLTFLMHPGCRPSVHSLESRFYGPDFVAAKLTIAAKCAKSREYGQASNGSPVGLFFYATGHGTSRIPTHLYDDDFCQTIRQTLMECDHCFAHVWWGIDLFVSGQRRIWKII